MLSGHLDRSRAGDRGHRILCDSQPKPPVATGEIVGVWAHAQHAESSGLDANGEAMGKASFDQVLVFTQVRLHNQSKGPLYVHNVMTNIKLMMEFTPAMRLQRRLRPGVHCLSEHARAHATPLATTDATIAPGKRLRDFRLVVPVK